MKSLTTNVFSKTPDLDTYKQTYKAVDGWATWYTTKNYTTEDALRVALTSITGAKVKQKREAKVDISREIQLYRPTKVTITAITVESKWSGSGDVMSDVDVNILDSFTHDIIAEFKSVGSDFESYKFNRGTLSLDVTGKNLFILEVYQYADAMPGGNDVKTRRVTIEFTFETDVVVSDFTLRCVDEEGYPMSGVHAKISGMSFELLTGEDIISLPDGNYTIEATAFIGKEKYFGELDFNIPTNVVTVILEWVPPPLPWYVIPLVVGSLGVGAIVTVGSVVGRPRAAPPVVILREKY